MHGHCSRRALPVAETIRIGSRRHFQIAGFPCEIRSRKDKRHASAGPTVTIQGKVSETGEAEDKEPAIPINHVGMIPGYIDTEGTARRIIISHFEGRRWIADVYYT